MPGKSSVKPFEALAEQGYEAYTEGDFDAAEEKLVAAVEMARELKISDMRVASVFNALGGVYRTTDRDEEALTVCELAFAIMEKECEPDDCDMAGVAANIAQIHGDLGHSDQALSWFKRAHEIAKGSIVISAKTALSYSDALLESGKAAEAAELLERERDEFLEFLSSPEDPMALMTDPMAEMIKEEFREEHREPPLLLRLRAQLAMARHELGQEDDSIATLPEMGTFEARTHGEDSRELGVQYNTVGVELHLLAQATHRRDHFAKAEKFYKQALEVLEKGDPDDPELQRAKDNLEELRGDVAKL